MSLLKSRLGYILLGLSMLSWGVVFVLPFVLTDNLGWWMSGLYGLSYVFWFGGIACLGKPAVERLWKGIKSRFWKVDL